MAPKGRPAKRRGARKRPESRHDIARRAAKRKARTPTIAEMIVRPIPSLGRIVQYNGPNGSVAPAMVTRGSADWRGSIALMVIGEFDTTRASDVPFSEAGTPGSWSWPPHVEPTREQIPLALARHRAATKIKNLAAKIEKEIDATPGYGEGIAVARLYAQEIQALAEKMDARTGKPDPSKRKKR